MKKHPLDELILKHSELSREEMSNFVKKINNDPEIIKQNEERNHNNLMKILGIKNEIPPITFRTLQEEIRDMCAKYDSESDESEKEEEEEEEVDVLENGIDIFDDFHSTEKEN